MKLKQDYKQIIKKQREIEEIVDIKYQCYYLKCDFVDFWIDQHLFD